MNELKLEDVMRALECCAEDTSEACLKCVFGLTPPYPVCKTMVAKQALALLREKDALLEEWDAKCKDYETELIGKCRDIEKLKQYCDEKDAEIERLKIEIEALKIANKKMYQASQGIRAEAIGEFEKILVEHYESPCYQPTKKNPIRHTDVQFLLSKIRETAKELKGENE